MCFCGVDFFMYICNIKLLKTSDEKQFRVELS